MPLTMPLDGALMAWAAVVGTSTGGFSPSRITEFGSAVEDGTVDANGWVAPKSGCGKRVVPDTGTCERPYPPRKVRCRLAMKPGLQAKPKRGSRLNVANRYRRTDTCSRTGDIGGLRLGVKSVPCYESGGAIG